MIKYNGKYVYVGNPRVCNITKPMWGTVGNLVFFRKLWRPILA